MTALPDFPRLWLLSQMLPDYSSRLAQTVATLLDYDCSPRLSWTMAALPDSPRLWQLSQTMPALLDSPRRSLLSQGFSDYDCSLTFLDYGCSSRCSQTILPDSPRVWLLSQTMTALPDFPRLWLLSQILPDYGGSP
jgi:hypothetical protein